MALKVGNFVLCWGRACVKGKLPFPPSAQPLSANLPSLLPVRHGAYWNDDWKPGPYPTTPEQRLAAAKKYGMRVEDYQPYEEVSFSWGDYPKFKATHADDRDKFYDWDDTRRVRDWNEPIHLDDENLWEFMTNHETETNPPFKIMMLQLASFTAVFFVLIYLGNIYKYFPALMEKQFYKPGKVYYTFEPLE